MLRAIKIDPKEQTITEVQVNSNDTLHSIYEHLGVDCFDLVRVDTHDWLYLDDMGHYRDEAYGFFWSGYPNVLINTALLFGDQDETTYDIEDVKNEVTFVGKLEKINGSR